MKPFRRRDASLLFAIAVAALATGCQTTLTKMGLPGGEKPADKAGYTCCNLHHEGDWISDSNYAELPMIPAGSAITVKGYGRNYASADIAGKPMRLGLDYGREQQTVEQFVDKIVVAEDPHKQLATWPPKIQDAIRAGKLLPGMTREQVLMAVGYPMANETSSLDSKLWRYWTSSYSPYQVLWSDQGLVSEIAADRLTYNLVVYR